MLKPNEMYMAMYDIVSEAHNGQMYGDHEYLYHLDNVVDCVESLNDLWGYSDLQHKLTTVALGHDLFEDTYITPQHLHDKGFPEEIIEAIDLVTKKDELSYKDYLRNLSGNELAWKVKVADTYSNLAESMKISDTKRVIKYTKQLELLFKFKGF